VGSRWCHNRNIGNESGTVNVTRGVQRSSAVIRPSFTRRLRTFAVVTRPPATPLLHAHASGTGAQPQPSPSACMSAVMPISHACRRMPRHHYILIWMKYNEIFKKRRHRASPLLRRLLKSLYRPPVTSTPAPEPSLPPPPAFLPPPTLRYRRRCRKHPDAALPQMPCLQRGVFCMFRQTCETRDIGVERRCLQVVEAH